MTRNWRLSAFDQGVPLGYDHPIFCLPVPPNVNQERIIGKLKSALEDTFQKWPFLAGTIGPAPINDPDLDRRRQHFPYHLQLSYDENNLKASETNFKVKTLTSRELRYTYQQLRSFMFPPGLLQKHLLSLSPLHPYRNETVPALTLQVNFFQDGGLLLCFAYHNSVTDITSFYEYIRMFTRYLGKKHEKNIAPVIPLESSALMRAPFPSLNSFDEFDFSETERQPLRDHRYLNVCKNYIFVFRNSTLLDIKDVVNETLQNLPEDQRVAPHVSTLDCLCALVWTATTMARRPRFNDENETISHFALAVNARLRMQPRLSRDFYGNMWVHAAAMKPVAKIVHGIAHDSVTLPSHEVLANTAAHIRAALAKVDDPYVRKRYVLRDFLQISTNPRKADTAFKRKINPEETGLNFSAWADWGANIDFDLGSGIGRLPPDAVRKPWCFDNGTITILPRRGGTAGPADWDVHVTLNGADMVRVVELLTRSNWVTKVLGRELDGI